MKDFEKDLLALGPYPSAPTPPPPPQTLDDAIALLAYGDRGVVDRPAVIAFIGEQIAAAVAEEREACKTIADIYYAGAASAADGAQRAMAARYIATSIGARGDR